MNDIELISDRYEDEQAELHLIRYNEMVEDYMENTGCSREVAEIRIEQSAGMNPDAHWR